METEPLPVLPGSGPSDAGGKRLQPQDYGDTTEEYAFPTDSSGMAVMPAEVRIGTLHGKGARPYQEDSYGFERLAEGVLAVVADGMGGLSDGDKVSKCITANFCAYAGQLSSAPFGEALSGLTAKANDAVNRMLGTEGLYKSGSTLLAVLTQRNRFHWIAVGDSHIYFYRRGVLVQLNQEHNRMQKQFRLAIRGEGTFEDGRKDKKKGAVTSFIGMGKLEAVERSLHPIELEPGDRIALMTDGVFNIIKDNALADIFRNYPDVEQAAGEIGKAVRAKAHPKQDNFTALILGV